MKIAQLLGPPIIGGIETFVLALTDALRDLGVEVDILLNQQCNLLIFNAKSADETKLNDYDIVHLHNPTNRIIPRLFNIKPAVVTTIHGDGRVWISTSKTIQLSRNNPKNRVTTPYQVTQKKLRTLGFDVDYIPTGIDTQIHPFHPSPGSAVVTFSRQAPIKRLDVVAEAYRLLQMKGYPSRLLIIGLPGPPYPPDAYGNSHFVMARPAQELLRDARACVVLGRPLNEGVGAPLILWEAMASGCNIIAARGSVGGQFADATFQFGDPVDLACAIAKAYTLLPGDENKQRREYVEKHRDIKVVAEQYLKLYSEAVE